MLPVGPRHTRDRRNDPHRSRTCSYPLAWHIVSIKQSAHVWTRTRRASIHGLSHHPTPTTPPVTAILLRVEGRGRPLRAAPFRVPSSNSKFKWKQFYLHRSRTKTQLETRRRPTPPVEDRPMTSKEPHGRDAGVTAMLSGSGAGFGGFMLSSKMAGS